MCLVTFRALRTMSVLVAAKRAASIVTQDCKVLSCPSEYILVLGINIKVRVITY